jgi:hypothetical protein
MTETAGGLILPLGMENVTAEPAMRALIFPYPKGERRAQPLLRRANAAGKSGPQKFGRSKSI